MTNNNSKWFMELDSVEFRKSLTRYHEVDSLDLFYEMATEFLDIENLAEIPLPETPEEAYTLGKMLYDLEAYADAEDWLRMAAEGGNAEAQVDYGMLLYRGCGKTQSFSEALKWYEAAMEQGSIDGISRAMQMYRSGGGFRLTTDLVCGKALEDTTPEERGKSPEKYADAKRRIREMADAGNPEAVAIYGALTEDIDILDDAAENGNIMAMRNLSNRYYLHMIPCEDSVEKAIYWAERAAELGDASSMHSLSLAYANGFGVEYDPEKAFKYAERAAEQGIVGARVELGRMYFFGTGVEQSYQKAREWFMTACHTGEAQYYLGEIHYRGLGVKRDDELAFEWYSLAMSNCHTEAKVKLAIMFANGHGVEKDSFATSSLLFDSVDEGSLLARDLEGCF